MLYPPPSSAAYIWSDGESLWLGLPGTGPSGQGNTVPFPRSPAGLEAALRCLEARNRAPESKLGTEAAPTRWQIEQTLKRREAFREERERKALERADRELARNRARSPRTVDEANLMEMLKGLGL